MNDNNIIIFYFQVTDIWKRFCEAHQELFELTCDEYHCLIKNNIEELNIIIEKKQTHMEYINSINNLRENIITDINLTYKDANIDNVKDLLSFMLATDIERDEKHLQRFNNFLISTIEKIQSQNMTNQQFLQKAMTSIEDVRESLLGKNKFQTYNAKGKTQNLARRF